MVFLWEAQVRPVSSRRLRARLGAAHPGSIAAAVAAAVAVPKGSKHRPVIWRKGKLFDSSLTLLLLAGRGTRLLMRRRVKTPGLQRGKRGLLIYIRTGNLRVLIF